MKHAGWPRLQDLPPSEDTSNFADYTDFYAAGSPVSYVDNPVIFNGLDPTYTNICPGGVIEDPSDATKILLYVGEFPGNTRTNSRVAVYRAPKSNPYNLTRVGLVLEKDATSIYDDQNGAAFGSILNDGGGNYLYYYTGVQGTGNGSQSQCLATTADGVTMTKVGQVVAPDGVNEFNLTDPTVRKFGGTYYMYSTAKNSAGLPIGIVIHSSIDHINWTRVGRAINLGTTRTSFDALYIESAEVFQLGASDYIMLYTASSQSNVWTMGIAHATAPDQLGWTKESLPWFQHPLVGPNKNSVAVACIYNQNDVWYMFHQGTTQFQPADTWDVCAAQFEATPDPFPPGFITGRSSWTGEYFFDTQGEIAVGTEDRSVRALDNTGFASVFVDYPVSVTAGVNSSYKATIRASAVSGASFWGGFYVMEGSTIVTGIYFINSQLQYLTSAGWTVLQAAAANTNYEIEVLLTSNSTFDVKVNGVSIVTAQTPNNNIVTSANKLRLEKAAASTRLIYYGDLRYKNLGTETIINIGQ